MSQDNTHKTYLILSASYGSGHVRAAEALVAHLTKDGHKAIHTDLLSFFTQSQDRLLRAPYIILMRHFPYIYGIAYKLLMQPWILRLFQISYQPIIGPKKKAILSYIRSIQPDIIICTHFTWGELLDEYIEKHIEVVPYYMVVTDYTYHTMWKQKHTSGYLLGSEAVRQKFLSANIPTSLLFVTGIPVLPIFSQLKQREKDKITILLGGYGITFPKKYIDTIIAEHTHIPIHIICGKNPKLVRQLKQRYQADSHVTIHGWVNTIPEYLSSSHMIITKTGGITMTECIVAGARIKPLPPIPGQETDNYYVLQTYQQQNAMLQTKNTESIPVFSTLQIPFLL